MAAEKNGTELNAGELKEDGKEVISQVADAAREGARQAVHEAKEVALDSLRYAKEHAFDSLAEGAQQVGRRARTAGHVASDFAATHAIPLTLLGAGAGWLLMSMSQQRRVQRSRYDLQTKLSEHASALRSQVVHSAAYVGHEAAELGRQAHDGIEWAGTRAAEVSEQNPLAMGLVALAAGAAVAMLLPPTRRENELLGQTRDLLWQKAQQSAAELKNSVERSVERSANDVREVIDEIRQPGSSHA